VSNVLFPGTPLPLECIKVRIFCECQPLSHVGHIQTTTFGFISPMRHHQQSRKWVLAGQSPTYMKFRLSSWIGSTNAFMLIAGGLFAGRLYDRGYLYVPFFFFGLCLNNAIIATIFYGVARFSVHSPSLCCLSLSPGTSTK
jgi:hypothetical protein